MIWWNAIFEIEKIEKLSLIARLPTHHDPPPPPNESRSNRESCPSANHEPFSTVSVRIDKTQSEYNESAYHSIADMRADITFPRSVPEGDINATRARQSDVWSGRL